MHILLVISFLLVHCSYTFGLFVRLCFPPHFRRQFFTPFLSLVVVHVVFTLCFLCFMSYFVFPDLLRFCHDFVTAILCYLCTYMPLWLHGILSNKIYCLMRTNHEESSWASVLFHSFHSSGLHFPARRQGRQRAAAAATTRSGP
jgi:hypothetical protein